MNTTAEWVGWSQEFRDQLCSLGFGSEKSDLPVMKTSRHFDKIRGSIICAKHGPIQTDLHFTAVFCLSTVDYLLQVLDFDDASCAGRRFSPGMFPRAEWTLV